MTSEPSRPLVLARLLRMPNDVLLLSRRQTGKMQLTSRPFGRRALVSDVMAALASSGELSRLRLTLLRAPEVFVKGDRERLFEPLPEIFECELALVEREVAAVDEQGDLRRQ